MKNITILFFLALFVVVPAFAQDLTVTGVVVDENGEELPGATILVKNGSDGTVTDIDGAFSLSVPENATLTVSFIGYVTQEIPLNGRTSIQVQMVPDISALEEVVVVGYGTMKKKDLTGAITSIGKDEIQQVKVQDAVQALQGKAAGVDVVRNDGRAGSGYTVKIRGESSLTGSTDPLYIVDGVYYDQGIDINPNDIESIDILKDASATSIYGPRGSNGVVIVTTKRGGSVPNVSFNFYGGVTSPLGDLPAMNREQYIEYLFDVDWLRAYNNDPFAGRFNASPDWALAAYQGRGEAAGYDNGTDYDWVDGVLKNGSQQDYNLSFSGQSDLVGYSMSVNHYNEKGLIENDEFKRYGFRGNLDAKMTDFLKLGLNTIVNYTNRNTRGSPLGGALSMSPLVEPYDSSGNLVPRPKIGKEDFTNPFITELPEYHYRNRRSTSMFATAYAEFTFLKNFTFRSTFNVDIDYRRDGDADESYPGSVSDNGDESNYARILNQNDLSWVTQHILTFQKDFNQDHSLGVTAGFEAISNRTEKFDVNYQNLALKNSQIYAIGSAPVGTAEGIRTPPLSALFETSRYSWLYRVNYSFKNRYLIATTGRLDNASQLAEGNKQDFFPAVSVGWNIHNESFFPSNPVLSSMKLRGGWGETGNEAVPAYSSFGVQLDGNGDPIPQQPLYYEFGVTENGVLGFRPVQSPNVGLEWETTRGWNAGVDIGLFNERVQAVVDMYLTETVNLLQQRTLAPSSGILSITDNVGTLQNKGIEVALTSKNIRRPNFTWTTNATFFVGRDKITELSSGVSQDLANGWIVGERINIFYDREKIGIWQADEREEAALYGNLPGDIKYRDVNGDTAITDADRVIIGNQDPKWIGGLTNRFTYKGIDLSIFVFARMGQTIQDRVKGWFFGNARELPMHVDYWTPNNPTNDMPSPASPQITNRSGSADLGRIQYTDGSFVKVRDITLGYTIPASLTQKIGIESLRIYATAQNAIVLSKYFTQNSSSIFEPTRWDPETTNARDSGDLLIRQSPGLGSLPPPKMFGGGIQVRL